jgi:hypothetical protein
VNFANHQLKHTHEYAADHASHNTSLYDGHQTFGFIHKHLVFSTPSKNRNIDFSQKFKHIIYSIQQTEVYFSIDI